MNDVCVRRLGEYVREEVSELALLNVTTDRYDWIARFESAFHLLFEQTSDQSIYQAQLPAELQLREYLQEWLRDETIAVVLSRLVNSTPVQVGPEVVAPFVQSDA